MSTNRTIAEIITAYGGAAAFSRIIGVNPSTASEMKRRGSIPVGYWKKLVAEMPQDGVAITYDELVEAHVEPKTAEAAA